MSEYIIELKVLDAKPAYPEVVRCRDCEHYDGNDAGCSYFVLESNKLLHIDQPDGFCAWGERRGE